LQLPREIEILKWKRFRQNITLKKRNVCSAVGGSGLIQTAVIRIDADDFVGQWR
jgi:hypothetical protein